MHVYLLLILNQIIFGTNFMASKQIVGMMPPIFFSGFRFFVSGIILLPFVYIKGEKITFSHVKIVAIPAMIGIALSQILFMVGISKTSASNAAFIASLIPVITLLFFFVSHKRKPLWHEFVGIAISFLGILILKLSPKELSFGVNLSGDILFFLGVLLTSLYILWCGPIFKKICPIVGSSSMFLIGGLMAMIASPIMQESLHLEELDLKTLFFPITYTIFFATLISYFLNNYILSKISVDTVALFIFLQPLVATLFSYFLLSEPLTVYKILALICIFLGLFLAKAPILLKKREKGNAN